MLATLILVACPSADTDPEVVCTFGMDQTCNDDPEISSLHGQCEPDGTCTCFEGFGGKNPETGRCL